MTARSVPSTWKNTRFLAGYASIALFMLGSQWAVAQQTLGSMNGTVTDSSGAVVQGATVRVRSLATNLEVKTESKSDGSFNVADLPIGTYAVRFAKNGFRTAVYPQIVVQGNRTGTLNAKLQPGTVASTVTVEATPLLNQTDTTIGYTLNELQIAETPLGTGEFHPTGRLKPGRKCGLAKHGGQQCWAGESGDLG